MLLLLRDIGEIVAGTRCEIGVVKLQTVTYGRAKGHKLCGAGARPWLAGYPPSSEITPVIFFRPRGAPKVRLPAKCAPEAHL